MYESWYSEKTIITRIIDETISGVFTKLFSILE